MKKIIEFLKYATLPKHVKEYNKRYEEYKQKEAILLQKIKDLPFGEEFFCTVDELHCLQDELDAYFDKYINRKGA